MSYIYSSSDRYVSYFDGAIVGRILEHPGRSFAVETTFIFNHPRMLVLKNQKSPTHFHPWQAEYFKVLKGELAVEIEGKERIVTPEDEEICIPRWTNHRIYNPIASGHHAPENSDQKVVVQVSGEKLDCDYSLDITFFENWYAYQDLIITQGKMPNILQLLSMWDAGDSYLSPPWWLPFGKHISLAMGIVLGRWIGGLLGYQPFFRKWTSNWTLACGKMRSSWTQRRFVDLPKED